MIGNVAQNRMKANLKTDQKGNINNIFDAPNTPIECRCINKDLKLRQ